MQYFINNESIIEKVKDMVSDEKAKELDETKIEKEEEEFKSYIENDIFKILENSIIDLTKENAEEIDADIDNKVKDLLNLEFEGRTLRNVNPELLKLFILQIKETYILDLVSSFADKSYFGRYKNATNYYYGSIRKRLLMLLENAPLANGLFKKLKEKKQVYYHCMLQILINHIIFKDSYDDIKAIDLKNEKNCEFLINHPICYLNDLHYEICEFFETYPKEIYMRVLDSEGKPVAKLDDQLAYKVITCTECEN